MWDLGFSINSDKKSPLRFGGEGLILNGQTGGIALIHVLATIDGHG